MPLGETLICLYLKINSLCYLMFGFTWNKSSWDGVGEGTCCALWWSSRIRPRPSVLSACTFCILSSSREWRCHKNTAAYEGFSFFPFFSRIEQRVDSHAVILVLWSFFILQLVKMTFVQFPLMFSHIQPSLLQYIANIQVGVFLEGCNEQVHVEKCLIFLARFTEVHYVSAMYFYNCHGNKIKEMLVRDLHHSHLNMYIACVYS